MGRVGRRVLVTGGAGFIGSHLCRRLLDEGCHVLCVDNFSTGSRSNVEPLLSHPRFELLEHDVARPLHVDVQMIYNLACPASPPQYQRDPIQTMKTSVLGAFNVLGMAKRLGIPVLQTSTSEVYGDPLQHPQTEAYWGNVNPIGLRSCYDEGKRCAETIFFDYHREHGVQVKVVRLFNTYGPRMLIDDGRVVSNFVIQALQNLPITIYGDGSQTRSFCYVEDTLDGIVRMMGTGPEVTGPVNLGNPQEFAVLELARKVIEMTGSASEIRNFPLPADDPVRRRPDISEAVRLFGWRPKVPLVRGLEQTIAYFESLLTLAGRIAPRKVRSAG